MPVAKSLSAGGFQDPTSESARATQLLTDKFHQGDMQLLFTVTAPDGVQRRRLRAPRDWTSSTSSKRSPNVTSVASAWTSPPQAAADLVSRDGKSGLVVAGITGGENDAPQRAQALADAVVGVGAARTPGVTVRAGGSAMVYSQINSQTERDVLVMESIAIPVSFLVLVWVFGGLLAAALPVVGGWAGDCRHRCRCCG